MAKKRRSVVRTLFVVAALRSSPTIAARGREMTLDKAQASHETAGMNLPDVREVLTELASDLLACLRFYSRLPIPPLGFEQNPYGAEISSRVKMLPLAGAL